MAIEKKLNTRIVLKHDTLENWNNAELVLKEGEIALAKIASATTGNYDTPTYLMKVGDNKSAFADLKWVAATAADVYDWAKQKNLPIEISGEGNGISNVEFKATELHPKGAIVVTKTAVEAAGAASAAETRAKAYADGLLVSAKSYADEAEANAVSTAAADATSKADTAQDKAVNHADDLNKAMSTRVDALEKIITGGEGGGITVTIDKQIDAKIALLDVDAVTAETGYVISSVSQKDGKVVAAKKQLTAADIPSLTVSKISDYATDVEQKITAKGYATTSEAQGYADAKDEAIAAAKKAGTDAQNTANTAVENAATAQSAAEAAQGTANTAVENAATAQSKADTADEHAVDAQTRVDKIEVDYLKKADKTELTKADAAQVERIAALEGKIDGVTGAMHFAGISTTDPAEGTVTINGEVYQGKSGDTVIYKTEGADTEFVYDGSAWIELGDTTQEAKDIDALEVKMAAAEGKLTTIQGEGAGSINKALADAKEYADGKVSALADGQVKTNTGAIAANASNISKNTEAISANTGNISKNATAISANTGNISKNTEAIEAINNPDTGILAKAKAHADGLNTTMDDRVTDIEGKVTGWDEAAGKANSAVQSVVGGDSDSGNGTIKVDNVAVKVYGLGSAAFTGSSAYATAAQGRKADTAVQPSALTDLDSKKHEHANKSELDLIASGDKKKWDDAAIKAGTALQEVTADAGLKVNNKKQVAFDDACIFVFDCGTSAI